MLGPLVVKTFEEFLERLHEHEINICSKYVLSKSPKRFSAEQVSPTIRQQIHWLDDTPFFNFGSRRYSCHQGKDINIHRKKKYAEERDRKAAMENRIAKRYKPQVTKKLGCPAVVTVSRVIIIPEHKSNGSGSGLTTYAKRKEVISIKKKIENGERVGEESYIFNLPDISEHSNHLIAKNPATSIEPVDIRVREYVTWLVKRGERNALVISKLLGGFVQNELQENDKMNRRFFPNKATIRSIISSAKSKLSKCPMDQENDCDFSSSLEQAKVLPQCQELPPKGSAKRNLVNACNAEIRSLQSILWYLSEKDLETVKTSLVDMRRTAKSKVCNDKTNGLPVEPRIDKTNGLPVEPRIDKINGLPVEPQTNVVKKRSILICIDTKRAVYAKLPLLLKRATKAQVSMVADKVKESASTSLSRMGEMV